MNYVLLVAGLLMLILVLIDVFKTILYIHGGGRLSAFTAKCMWRGFFLLSGKSARSKWLNFAGGTILLMLLVQWIALLWLGYSLIFISDSGSVVDAITNGQTTVFGKIYYVGYVLTTLGNGDMKASTDGWRIVTNLMAMNSLVLLSLGISYVVPVLEAVIDKRTIAAHIQKLGRTPSEIIENGYTGKDFSPLYDRFSTLESMLLKHGERYLAYPILHYFNSSKRSHALHISLAVLDEAIAIQEAYTLDTSDQAYSWRIMRKSVEHLKAMYAGGNTPIRNAPPPFDYHDRLPATFKEKNRHQGQMSEDPERDERRARLREYLSLGGWDWEDVTTVKE